MASDPDQIQHCMIDTFPIDATVSEDHTFESEVTEYPVEVGGDITDHVRPKPITVTMDCIVSDTPMGDFLTDPTRQTNYGPTLPSQVIYDRLLIIRDTRTEVVIRTSLGRYPDMLLTNLSIPRKAATGHSIEFTATFQRVIFVKNKRTTVRVSAPSGGGQKNVGHVTGLKGKERIYVFTSANNQTVKVYQSYVQLTPVLVDAKGRHWGVFAGSPPSDGWVDNTGYHAFGAYAFDPTIGAVGGFRGADGKVIGKNLPPDAMTGAGGAPGQQSVEQRWGSFCDETPSEPPKSFGDNFGAAVLGN